MNLKISYHKILSCFLVLVLITSGCASSDKKQGPKISSDVSEEIAIGEQIHSRILSDFYAYTDPLVVAYVQQITRSLSEHAKRKDLPYQTTVLYNERIYATSAPGGFIYLTTGLLNMLDNESELAAVIAHEIGHLQFRAPGLSRSLKVLEAVSRTGAAVGPMFGEIGALAVLGLVLINSIVDLAKVSPEERLIKADSRALRYMVDAGHDPQGLIDLLYKFLNADEILTPYFFDYYQGRPITEERFQKLQVEFSKLPLEGKTFSTNRRIYQDVMKGIRQMYAA